METALVARRCLFSSAHFYKQDAFSDQENERVFGLCYSRFGHGHNYVVEAFVEGPIDSHTRLVMDLAVLDRILKQVTEKLEHKHLNFEVPELAKSIPTTENIASFLHERIRAEVEKTDPRLSLNRTRLFETDDLWVEVRG